MSLFLSIILALVVAAGGFALSLVIPRFVRHEHRSGVMILFWVITLAAAIGIVLG